MNLFIVVLSEVELVDLPTWIWPSWIRLDVDLVTIVLSDVDLSTVSLDAVYISQRGSRYSGSARRGSGHS